MILSFYLLMFCRIVIGSVFAISSASKIVGFPKFKEAIRDFNITPENFTTLIALCTILAELLVFIQMILGNQFVFTGLVQALVLLSCFSLIIVSALRRNIKTSCNCFGPSRGSISWLTVLRNGVFMVCALVGIGAYTTNWRQIESLTATNLIAAGATAFVFVMIWTQIIEVIRLLNRA